MGSGAVQRSQYNKIPPHRDARCTQARSNLKIPRRRVYPRLVTQGRMEEGEAQHEIALMRDIVANLEAQLNPPLTFAEGSSAAFPEARPAHGIDW